MSDFDWPSPVPGDGSLVEERPQSLADEYRLQQTRHRTHERAGEIGCPICVFTVDGFLTSPCGTCHAPIVWAITEDGKRMPVDGPLTDGGNVVLRCEPGPHGAEIVRAVVLDQAGLFDDGPRHTSHFATCPDADTWRRGRR